MGYTATRHQGGAHRAARRIAALLVVPLLAAGCTLGRGPAPAVPAHPDAALLLKEVDNQVLAARNAQFAFLLAYPVEGMSGARRHVAAATDAVGRARAAVAATQALDPTSGAGPPRGCCAELTDTIARFGDGFDRLVDLTVRRGDARSGLIGAVNRNLDRLEHYLDRLEYAEASAPEPGEPSRGRTQAIRAIRADVDAMRRYEAEYHLRDTLGSIMSIGQRVVSQREFLETSPLDARERARVDTHIRTYLIYLERLALTDVDILQARFHLNQTSERIHALVRAYLGEGLPRSPGGIVI